MSTLRDVLAARARRASAYLSIAAAAACVGDPTGAPRVAAPADAHLARRAGDVQVIDLGILAGPEAEARAVNDAGDAVGWGYAAGGGLRALLWRDGQVIQLGPLGVSSEAMGINRSGEIVGHYQPATFGPTRGFIWRDGQVTDLGSLGGSTVIAWAINDRGQVVGLSEIRESGPVNAFLWEDGRMTDLGRLGGSFASGLGLNRRGDVVGYTGVNDGTQHAFLWRDGEMTDLGTLGGSGSIAFSINASGQIVGYSFTPSLRERAVLWQAGEMIDLGALPGHDRSWAREVNSRGDIVGHSWSGSAFDQRRPVLWTNGTVIDLGTLGGAFGSALAINDKGVIVGYSQAPDGRQHATMWVTRGRAP